MAHGVSIRPCLRGVLTRIEKSLTLGDKQLPAAIDVDIGPGFGLHQGGTEVRLLIGRKVFEGRTITARSVGDGAECLLRVDQQIEVTPCSLSPPSEGLEELCRRCLGGTLWLGFWLRSAVARARQGGGLLGSGLWARPCGSPVDCCRDTWSVTWHDYLPSFPFTRPRTCRVCSGCCSPGDGRYEWVVVCCLLPAPRVAATCCTLVGSMLPSSTLRCKTSMACGVPHQREHRIETQTQEYIQAELVTLKLYRERDDPEVG